jgi:hypothetical protein
MKGIILLVLCWLSCPVSTGLPSPRSDLFPISNQMTYYDSISTKILSGDHVVLRGVTDATLRPICLVCMTCTGVAWVPLLHYAVLMLTIFYIVAEQHSPCCYTPNLWFSRWISPVTRWFLSIWYWRGCRRCTWMRMLTHIRSHSFNYS